MIGTCAVTASGARNVAGDVLQSTAVEVTKANVTLLPEIPTTVNEQTKILAPLSLLTMTVGPAPLVEAMTPVVVVLKFEQSEKDGGMV